jgi:hypothetical protein
MAGSVFAVILASASSATTHATGSSSGGSNIGPALPIILALVIIGVAVYLIRQRRRRPPNGHDS